jgi:peptidoglycan L-alanyl-D-glutamate endopeptidase CwlK
MPRFSVTSQQRLDTCHPNLKEICENLINQFNFTVVSGHRGEKQQEKLVEKGRSQVHYPNSKHNKDPSLAVDIAPYRHDFGGLVWGWDKPESVKRKYFHFQAGLVMREAHRLGYDIQWGGDWDSDLDFTDQNFHDLPHFALEV